MCPMQYFIEYNLGHRSPSNKKADKGTICHKVFEILAFIKLNQQQNNRYFEDDIIGPVDITNYNLNTIIEQVYNFYTSQFTHHEWTTRDFKDCDKWVYKALEYGDGMFDPRNRDIIQPEQHFDIEIKKDWAKYDYHAKEGHLQGNLAIKGTIDLITKVNDDTYEIIDWKGLPVDTKLPTPDGWTTMGEISVGDTVFDQYGQKCIVTGKSAVKTKPCYRITFDDKSSVVCDNEHLWKLSDSRTVCVTELKTGDKINVTKPIDCEYRDLPIEPYLLGTWLGDGRNRNCEISSGDKELFDLLFEDGHIIGKNLENRKDTLRSSTILKETHNLKKLNLLNNKHIPEIYFRAPFEQRLMLLKGLMDTDGNVNIVRKQAVFTSCNKTLAHDVKHLALTLGQRPYIYQQKRQTTFTNGKNIDVYHVCFRPIDINPFRISRKANMVDDKWGPGRSSKRTIINIEQSIVQHTQCIAVDSPDNTYLCTENFIPTHNTGRRLDWATGQEKTLEKLHKDPQLMLYYYAIHKLYPDIKHVIVSINFINDGGMYSVCFDQSHIYQVEMMLRKKFEDIKNTTDPKLNKSWKCTKLCHFGKNTFEGTDYLPSVEYRENQITTLGQNMTICEQIKHEIAIKGMDNVIDEYQRPGYNIGQYKAPGSAE